MKKLLIIAYYFPPINSSGVHRTIGFIKYLPRNFWEISVLTVNSCKNCKTDNNLSAKIDNSIRVYRTRCIDYFHFWKRLKPSSAKDELSGSTKYIASGNATSGYWQTIKNQISGLLQTPDNQAGWFLPALLRSCTLPRPDVIYSTAPPFTGLVIAAFLKRMWKVPLIVDFRDPWSGNPFNVVHGGMVTWLDNLLEKHVIKKADAIIANTGSMARHFRENFPEAKGKIHVITNGYDPDEYHEVKPLRSVDKGALFMVHIGLLYEQRNPLPFLQALKHLLADHSFEAQIAVQLIGTSEAFEGQSLEELIQQLELTHIVELVPPVSHQEALARAKGADVLLLFAQGTNLQIPAKLFEYLALGPPILAICEKGGATQEMLSGFQGHQVATRNSAGDIERCIRDLHIDWQQKNENYQRRNQCIEKLSRRQLTRELENILLSHSGA